MLSLQENAQLREGDFNVACLLSCGFFSSLSIVEDTSFVTPHHLRRLMVQSICSPLNYHLTEKHDSNAVEPDMTVDENYRPAIYPVT
jgi:hypothetical protein